MADDSVTSSRIHGFLQMYSVSSWFTASPSVPALETKSHSYPPYVPGIKRFLGTLYAFRSVEAPEHVRKARFDTCMIECEIGQLL
jgi:hypothetical protein